MEPGFFVVAHWIHQDFRAVSSVQREGYLTYAATLEVTLFFNGFFLGGFPGGFFCCWDFGGKLYVQGGGPPINVI